MSIFSSLLVILFYTIKIYNIISFIVTVPVFIFQLYWDIIKYNII